MNLFFNDLETPFHAAVRKSDLKMASEMIAKGADLKLKRKRDGNIPKLTPAEIAIFLAFDIAEQVEIRK